MRPSDFVASTQLTGLTHFRRHEIFWRDLMQSVQSTGQTAQPLNVLVTACSIGAEVYDAARVAKTLGLENVHFYGHDISRKFITRAVEGIYPVAAVLHVPEAEQWFEFDKPFEGYARARKESFNNLSFLQPSDIRDLKEEFDIVVANIMNPPPANIEMHLGLRSRHMALSNYQVTKVSEIFQLTANAYEHAFADSKSARRARMMLAASNDPDYNVPSAG